MSRGIRLRRTIARTRELEELEELDQAASPTADQAHELERLEESPADQAQPGQTLTDQGHGLPIG